MRTLVKDNSAQCLYCKLTYLVGSEFGYCCENCWIPFNICVDHPDNVVVMELIRWGVEYQLNNDIPYIPTFPLLLGIFLINHSTVS